MGTSILEKDKILYPVFAGRVITIECTQVKYVTCTCFLIFPSDSLNEAEYLVTKAYASHDFMDKIVSIGNIQINSLSFYAVT